jgi:glycosyltransferase EpsH
MPKASIVIPCYNAERFVTATIQSAKVQTMADLEIVCVNDGSTDNTLELLEELAREDDRIRVIDRPNGGEGPARDAGRAAAIGEWLYFLDADDFMRPTLLEEAIRRGEETEADVVIFKTQELDDQSGAIRDFKLCFDVDWLDGIEVFCPLEHPQRIFTSFQNWVHNKLFRRTFVEERGLAFQHVRRSADLLFTCRALSEASRIALLDRALHLYRVNNPSSALFTSDVGPLDFYKGFLALRDALEANGTWELFHDSYVNWAQEGVSMNLYRTRSLDDFVAIVDAMHEGGAERLDLMGIPCEESVNPERWGRCHDIMNCTLPELLFRYYLREKVGLDYMRTECSWKDMHLANQQSCIEDQDRIIKKQHEDFHNVLNSSSYRIGRSITSLPRRASSLLRRQGE